MFMPALIAAGQGHQNSTPHELISLITKSKTDTGRIAVLLKLGKYFVDKPNENKNDLDSAYFFLNQATKLSEDLHAVEWKIKALELTAQCDGQAGNIPHAKACFMQMTDYYHKTNNKQQEAIHWNELGNLIPADNTSEIQYKIRCFEYARSLFQQTRNKQGEIETLQNIAETHFTQGKTDQAESELLQVLSQYKAMGYKKLNDTYDLLAEINKSKPDLHKELFYRLELVKNMEATADTSRSDYYYSKLALAYSDLGMYPQSLAQIMQSIRIIKRRGKFEDFYGDLSLVMFDFISEGKPAGGLAFLKKTVQEVPPQNLAQTVDMNEEFANCYKALKQYDKAEQYYLEMMRLFKITGFNKDFYSANSEMWTDYIYYYQTLGNFYLLTKRFQKAGFYVNKLLKLPKDAIRPISLRKILLMKFRVDSASGNYISAINYFEMYKNLNDSLFNVTKSRQIADMLEKYKSVKKEQAIKLLESQGRNQYAELQKANLQRNITFVGIAMLLVIAGLAYKGYVNKQRSNLKLQVKQQEINRKNLALESLVSEKDDLLTEKDWLLKEVHHRVKNNLQIVMSLLSTQSAYLQNSDALDALRQSQNRVQSISLIHQKLYSGSNVASIDMPAYIGDLINYLRDCFDTRGRSIRFEQLVEPIKMDLAQAVPLGLILNEGITNAIKYAFTEKDGHVIVALQLIGHEIVLLTIADNGRGLPEGFDIKSASSLGMEMIKALSKQLGGSFKVKGSSGVTLTIEFPLEKVLYSSRMEDLYN